MSMRLRFWGTRGSIPSPGPHTVRYGGNTPCLEVRTGTGALVILDAGTGLRELGRALMDRANGNAISAEIFLTHTHWDHIQGIPFFSPIYQEGNHFTIWGAATAETDVEQVIRDQMSRVVFPLTFDEVRATVEFRELRETSRSGDGYHLTTFGVRHPGGALGYRVSEPGGNGGSFVYISDNELGDGGDYDTRAEWREQLVGFVRGARLLVHDATYTAEEYDSHRGWGHSTYDDAVQLALDAGVRDLVLFHHKPERTDDEVDRCVMQCRAAVKARGGTLSVVAATEGLSLTV
jgi:phosphoribosyl 1,2-cyclic phosphodiesterase